MKTYSILKISIALFCGLALGATAATALAAGAHGGGHGGKGGYAFGMPGKAAAAQRTIRLIATDNAFDLSKIKVHAGETVRFIIANKGEFLHEFNLGLPAMHREHQAEMTKMMESGALDENGMTGKGMMKHDDPNSTLIKPGETKELTWTFKHSRNLEFACNLPGHYESGMLGKVQFSKTH